MRLWRLTAWPSKGRAFDGLASARSPGRWNQRGRPTVYAASSVALAVLEIVVQSGSAPLLGYHAYPIDVPDGLIVRFDRTRLSPAWRSVAGRDECRVFGEAWRSEAAHSLGLMVPSAVIPEAYTAGDWCVVLDRTHGRWSEAAIGEPIALDLDQRIVALLGR
ncbi:RES domain-containing protein [bacterium]|nr:MAG: RES domain-containing protein [bacterium]